MKKILLLTLLLVVIVCAVSCGGESTYKTDVKTTDIASTIQSKLSNAGVLVAADELYLSSFNPAYTSLISEWTVLYSSTGTLFDEFGVFKVDNAADTDGIVTMINEYIQYRVDADMGYVPAELPKIKDAKTKVCGNYVIYTFLSDADTTSAFEAFEAALVK